MPKKKKPLHEMHDRELAEHLFGKRIVAKMHEEFDLRDTSEMEQSQSQGQDKP